MQGHGGGSAPVTMMMLPAMRMLMLRLSKTYSLNEALVPVRTVA